MNFIRCSRYEYFAKIGSISNYSYHLKDEEKSGILEVLFEETTFPMEKDELMDLLRVKTVNIETEQMEDLLKRMIEIEVLYELTDNTSEQISVTIITDRSRADMVATSFHELDYQVKLFTLEDDGEESSLKWNVFQVDNEAQASEQISEAEYVLLFKTNFSPALLYKINKLCLDLHKKLIISYLDGHEGVIIPLVNFNQVGCYNDFELLRESSFYNLLDYQIMKEQLMENDKIPDIASSLHFNALLNQTILLFDHYVKYTNINYYAYSFDFERMVNTKMKLFKFPKCPSCQGEKNLVHAFI